MKGQILIVVLFLFAAIFAFLIVTSGIGYTVRERIAMQKAVDTATISAAVWQARGLNVIADLNWVLIAAIGSDVVKAFLFGGVNTAVYDSIIEAQVIASQTFPGAAGLAFRQVFKENMKNASCYPLPTGIQDGKMFSLRVRRKELDLWILGKIKLWMEKDTPQFWENQKKTGPYMRLFAVKEKQPFIFGGKFVGLNVPVIRVISQAAPYLRGESGFLGGGLWNPKFDAKLIPVTASIPGFNELVLH